MADSLIDFSDEAEEGDESKCDYSEICDFPQTLVTEKIIFVVDILLLATESGEGEAIYSILDAYKGYYNLKKKICLKPPEFECLLYNNKDIITTHISTVKDLQCAFVSIQNMECEDDNEPLKIDKIFDKIAQLVELPDPACSKKCLPPNWVYHVIWLFGQNLHFPTMENTNSFDFLMMSPYFALDMLYLYDGHLEDNQCKRIAEALQSLNENGKGYFLKMELTSDLKRLLSCFAQFLGHPLIRAPQKYAMYNIVSLGCEIEIHNDKGNPTSPNVKFPFFWESLFKTIDIKCCQKTS